MSSEVIVCRSLHWGHQWSSDEVTLIVWCIAFVDCTVACSQYTDALLYHILMLCVCLTGSLHSWSWCQEWCIAETDHLEPCWTHLDHGRRRRRFSHIRVSVWSSAVSTVTLIQLPSLSLLNSYRQATLIDRLSVCLSVWWIVTKLNDELQIFLYHTKGQSLCYSESDTNSGWWATPLPSEICVQSDPPP